VLTFSSPVSVSGNPQAAVTVGTGAVGNGGVPNGGAVNIAGGVVTVPLTNVANAQAIVVTLFGVSNGTNTGNLAIPMGVLLGDSSGDRVVNAGDVTLTRNRSGQGATAGNFRSDYSFDGFVNAGDVTIARTRAGNFIP
jgi:hypothetical protein